MSRDLVVLVGLVLGLAVFVTAHVVLAIRLTSAPERWRGLVALLVPPLGVLWGVRRGHRVNVAIVVASIGVYVIALIVAR